MRQTLISTKLKNGAFKYFHELTTDPNDNQHTSYMTDAYQIFYLVSGNVIYQIEGQDHKLTPGDLLIINNKEMHRPYFTSDENYERILVFFTPEFCSHYNREDYSILHFFEKRRPGCFNKLENCIAKAENLANYFTRIEAYINENLPESRIQIEIEFIKLLMHINQALTSQPNHQDFTYEYNKKIEQIMAFINLNLFRPIQLKEIEETFFINKFYFSHLFKKTTGVSFKEYIISKKITKASELLKLSIPPLEVSRLVGFEDYSNFYKAFKRITGFSPSKY